MVCHNCQGVLNIFDNFSSLYQVSSDCRPLSSGGKLGVCIKCGMVQKPVTKEWLDEADQIYAGYDIYSQSGGIEQSAFDQTAGASAGRSQKIVEWLLTTGMIAKTGKLLDVGCGNGAFLSAFGKKYEEWEMIGLELDERSKDVIEAISGVKRLYVGSPEELNERFDLIVLIHALEHIPQPVEYLKTLKNLLNPGGLLFIEVPDLETSPFDILIADHSTHFVSNILNEVVVSAGLETIVLKSDFVPKELSLLARCTQEGVDAQSIHGIKSIVNAPDIAENYIKWLHELVENGKMVSGEIGIFGTSIAGTWLAKSLGDKVTFFIDEDNNRVGRTHMGRPIYSPADAPQGKFILFPLRIDIASAIKKRLGLTDSSFAI